uniref:Uncharacterized protein n=1 Tax=Setaria italica TaxID=4555 RepID=K3ZYM6_SETIT
MGAFLRPYSTLLQVLYYENKRDGEVTAESDGKKILTETGIWCMMKVRCSSLITCSACCNVGEEWHRFYVNPVVRYLTVLML